jgi:hypothetical protein
MIRKIIPAVAGVKAEAAAAAISMMAADPAVVDPVKAEEKLLRPDRLRDRHPDLHPTRHRYRKLRHPGLRLQPK